MKTIKGFREFYLTLSVGSKRLVKLMFALFAFATATMSSLLIIVASGFRMWENPTITTGPEIAWLVAYALGGLSFTAALFLFSDLPHRIKAEQDAAYKARLEAYVRSLKPQE